MKDINESVNIDASRLREWLDEGKPVVVLDVRPKDQREEWSIPGSIHVDAYKRLNEGDNSVLDEADIPENAQVVTVCAAGRTSQIAANALREKGIEAYSLEGGMKGWSLSWNTAEIVDDSLKIIQVRRTGKGCLSYVIGSKGEAVVLDASLDLEVYVNIAKQQNWKIKYVIDTHIHADHFSRSKALAENSGSTLYMPDQEKLKYAFNKIKDGDSLYFGSSELKAIHTPGHTADSMTFIINRKYLFTGDTLFTDGVGRPDLKASEDEARQRAKLLFKSLLLLTSFEDDKIVLPGHISKPVPFDHKVITAELGQIKEKVTTLSLTENDFVETILSKLPSTPPNYLKVTELNLAGDTGNTDLKEIESGANRCAIQ